MPGLTPTALLKRLEGAGMSRNSIWIEHSSGSFDMRAILSITPPELRYILPAPENVYTTLSLWRHLLPGFYSHALGQIFSLLRPDDELIRAHHTSLPVALMCRELFRIAHEIYDRG